MHQELAVYWVVFVFRLLCVRYVRIRMRVRVCGVVGWWWYPGQRLKTKLIILYYYNSGILHSTCKLSVLNSKTYDSTTKTK